MTLNAVCSALHIAWRFAEVFTGWVSRTRLDGVYLQPNKRKHLVKACGFMRLTCVFGGLLGFSHEDIIDF
jgi:hypothetical protein